MLRFVKEFDNLISLKLSKQKKMGIFGTRPKNEATASTTAGGPLRTRRNMKKEQIKRIPLLGSIYRGESYKIHNTETSKKGARIERDGRTLFMLSAIFEGTGIHI